MKNKNQKSDTKNYTSKFEETLSDNPYIDRYRRSTAMLKNAMRTACALYLEAMNQNTGLANRLEIYFINEDSWSPLLMTIARPVDCAAKDQTILADLLKILDDRYDILLKEGNHSGVIHDKGGGVVSFEGPQTMMDFILNLMFSCPRTTAFLTLDDVKNASIPENDHEGERLPERFYRKAMAGNKIRIANETKSTDVDLNSLPAQPYFSQQHISYTVYRSTVYKSLFVPVDFEEIQSAIIQETGKTSRNDTFYNPLYNLN